MTGRLKPCAAANPAMSLGLQSTRLVGRVDEVGSSTAAFTAMTSFYYQAVCDSDEAAVRAFHATYELFDSVPDVTSFARKRFGSALLYRFDDQPDTITRMLEILRGSGHFREVSEITKQYFWQSPSNGV